MTPRILRPALLAGAALALVILSALTLNVSRAAPSVAPSAPAADFGYGAYIQLVDPDGRRSVDLNLPGAQTVPFTLHALPLEKFQVVYRATNSWQALAVDTSTLGQVAAWSESFDPASARPSAHIPPSVGPGIYVLTSSDTTSGQSSQIIVIVTRYVLALKGGDGQIAVWAARLQTGAPAAGVAVDVLGPNGVLTSMTTDDDGLASANVTWDENTLAVGQIGGEMTVAGLRSEWRTDYWGGWWWSGNQPAHERVFIYTDRPIYRPAQDVYYKAVLRGEQDAAYTLPTPTDPITVTLRDSRSNVVAMQHPTPNDFGTMDGTFHLGSRASLGDYNLQVTHGGTTTERTFQVQEYRKPEFEVKVTASPDPVILGDSLTVSVTAGYYFGAPVPNAPVNIKLKQSYWWWGGGTAIAEVTGVTDAQGRYTGKVPTTVQNTWDQPLSVEASVTDATAQVVTSETSVHGYYAGVQLESSLPKYAYQPGENVALTMTLRDRQNQPVTNHSLVVTTTHYYNTPDPDTTTQTITTTAGGRATLSYPNVKLGWYSVQASALDDRGRAATTWAYFWVYDPANSGGWYVQANTIEVRADAASYRPGDTAHLLIKSPVNGPALLTLERGRVRREMVVQLSGAATQVDVPILADDAPTLYARVQIWQRAAASSQGYYWASTPEGQLLVSPPVEMAVSAEAKRLTVDTSADHSEYRPGGTAALTLHVTSSGQPVRAEVSLALVDEGIFALADDTAGNPFDTFYGRRDLGVGTWDSLRPQRYLNGIDRPPVAAPTNTPVPTTPGALTPQVGQGVRQDFRDTAYWNARIVTDAAGNATVSIPLPDNLTRWRIVARAVTADTLAGMGQSSIIVNKPVAVQPALPRFLVLGDRAALDTVVTNRSGGDINASVNLTGTGLLLLSGPPLNLVVPDGQQRSVHWSAVASHVGSANVLSSADAGALADAAATPLPVKPFAVPERLARAGIVDPSVDLPFDVPLNAVTDDSVVELRLAPSIALSLLEGLDELVAYPYGCVEQTMSRVLPNAAVAQTYHRLGIANPDLDRRLPDIMADGLQRLYGFQRPDGGWGWWYDDDSAVYQTTYVLFGLLQVRASGFDVDQGVLDRGFAFLVGQLGTATGSPSTTQAAAALDPRLRTYALYVLALGAHGNLSQSQALLTAPDRLDPFGLAALAMTLKLLGDSTSANAAADLLAARAVDTGGSVHWVAPHNEEYAWRTMMSDEKTTGMALRALSQARPTSPLLPGAARWLMDQRDGKTWPTTQASAFAILGLTDYILLSGEMDANYDWRVTRDGGVLAHGHVDHSTATQPIPPVVLRGSDLTPGTNILHIERTGPGRLYYALNVRLSLFYPQFQPVAFAGTGIGLKRSYVLAETGPGGATPTPVRDGAPTPRTEFALGDVVEVHLTLDLSETMSYVLIEDQLPAGFEPLNERVNPIIWTPWDMPPMIPIWWQYGYNNKELHDDHVSFFVTSLGAGQHEFTYRMRATRPGQFSALPAEAYPMYRPEIWGRSASDQVTVERSAFVAPRTLHADQDRSCTVDMFDVRLVALAWATPGSGHASAADVARTMANVGRTCVTGDAAQPAPLSIAPRVRLVPRSAQVVAGSQFLVDVVLEGATSIRGYDLAVTVPPGVARIDAVEPLALLAGAVTLGPTVDRAQGRAAWGGVVSDPIGGNGATIGTLRLTALQTGSINLTIESAQVLDAVGQPHTADVSGAQVITGGHRLIMPYIKR